MGKVKKATGDAATTPAAKVKASSKSAATTPAAATNGNTKKSKAVTKKTPVKKESSSSDSSSSDEETKPGYYQFSLKQHCDRVGICLPLGAWGFVLPGMAYQGESRVFYPSNYGCIKYP